jgi:hypothetical protein
MKTNIAVVQGFRYNEINVSKYLFGRSKSSQF